MCPKHARDEPARGNGEGSRKNDAIPMGNYEETGTDPAVYSPFPVFRMRLFYQGTREDKRTGPCGVLWSMSRARGGIAIHSGHFLHHTIGPA